LVVRAAVGPLEGGRGSLQCIEGLPIGFSLIRTVALEKTRTLGLTANVISAGGRWIRPAKSEKAMPNADVRQVGPNQPHVAGLIIWAGRRARLRDVKWRPLLPVYGGDVLRSCAHRISLAPKFFWPSKTEKPPPCPLPRQGPGHPDTSLSSSLGRMQTPGSYFPPFSTR